MAEGLGKALAKDRFEIRSAGVCPVGVHPMAARIMKEIGIDISEHTSDFLDTELLRWADYVITLCGYARDNSPLIPPGVKHFHWDIENPDIAYLSEDERSKGFRKVRDEIKKRIEDLFAELG
jgi:arsenate reductase